MLERAPSALAPLLELIERCGVVSLTAEHDHGGPHWTDLRQRCANVRVRSSAGWLSNSKHSANAWPVNGKLDVVCACALPSDRDAGRGYGNRDCVRVSDRRGAGYGDREVEAALIALGAGS